jgi:tetratricopeptide (TPR) repeat protein
MTPSNTGLGDQLLLTFREHEADLAALTPAILERDKLAVAKGLTRILGNQAYPGVGELAQYFVGVLFGPSQSDKIMIEGLKEFTAQQEQARAIAKLLTADFDKRWSQIEKQRAQDRETDQLVLSLVHTVSEKVTALERRQEAADQHESTVRVALREIRAVLRDLQARSARDEPGAAEALALLARGDTRSAERFFLEEAGGQRESPEARLDAARALRSRAALALVRDPSSALDSLREAIALDPNDASAHDLLGLLEFARGEFDKAESSLRHAVRIAEEQNCLDVLPGALASLAAIARIHGDLDASGRMLRRAEGLATTFVELAIVHIALGNLRLVQGDFAAAADRYRVALGFAAILEDKRLRATAVANSGVIALHSGRPEEAQAAFDEAFGLHEDVGDRFGMALVHGYLGAAFQSRGDDVSAEKHFRLGLALDTELGNTGGIAARNGDLGVIHGMRGEFDAAEARFVQALQACERAGVLEGVANQCGNLALLEKKRGRPLEAIKWFEKSIDVEHRLGRPQGLLTDYTNLGLLHRQQGQISEALEALHRALALARTLRHEQAIVELTALIQALESRQ